MNNDTAIVLMLADRQRDIEALRSRVSELERENAAAGGGFVTIANGRRVAQVPTGEWVAADDGGWLPGVRATPDDWLSD